MRSYDLSPLFRSTIGFDRLDSIFDNALRGGRSGDSYPPYNIEVAGEDRYRITMAVAGFDESNLDIVARDNQLSVSGKIAEPGEDEPKPVYLHRGLARRAFEHRFQLADHVQVQGASLANGLLTIELARVVPEALKPRKIAIAQAAPANAEIERKAA